MHRAMGEQSREVRWSVLLSGDDEVCGDVSHKEAEVSSERTMYNVIQVHGRAKTRSDLPDGYWWSAGYVCVPSGVAWYPVGGHVVEAVEDACRPTFRKTLKLQFSPSSVKRHVACLQCSVLLPRAMFNHDDFSGREC